MTNIDKRLDEIEKKLDGMSGIQYPVFGNQISSSNDEIDLRELWGVVWGGKWVIIVTTFVCAIVSVLYALSLPNVYKSEALLAPAEENSGGGLSGLAGQFGGLASLAGVSIGGGGSDKTALAIEVLKSREFLTQFIEKYNLLVPLMAAEDWDSSSEKLMINAGIYDVTRKEWVRAAKGHKGAKPSLQEAYESFTKKMAVVQDKKNNFISVSMEFYSPLLARQWVEWLVRDINEEMKSRDVSEAEKSVKYLSQQLEQTSIADMQAVFYELIEEQSKTIMFAKVRDEYVFKTIDKAVVPERKLKPKRSIICVMGVLLGGMLGVFMVFVRYFFKSSSV